MRICIAAVGRLLGEFSGRSVVRELIPASSRRSRGSRAAHARQSNTRALTCWVVLWK